MTLDLANDAMSSVPESGAAGQTLYDKIPYESRPYPRAHVDRLATVATLKGMTPPPIGACRVLEIGCASGGHLIPMALALPGSEFVGIDISGRELDEGRQMVARLGLKNVHLLHRGIEAVGDSLGQFDYIVCHGVYSWVPAEVRQGILHTCRQTLSPQGVAYISYNTYPGWHFRDVVRNMMRYHARAQGDPLSRAAEGRRLLEFLVKSVPGGNSAYGAVLKSEANVIRGVADWYLCHDHMADVNEPLYFHQFAAQAAEHHLQYVGEAQFGAMLPRGLPPDVVTQLSGLSKDIIAQQQYLDFVKATPFRHSLLCHESVTISHAPKVASLNSLHVAAQAEMKPAAVPTTAAPGGQRAADTVTFSGPGGTLSTNRPLMKAAIRHLMKQWPRTVAFPALCATAASEADPSPVRSAQQVQADQELLGGIILKGYFASDLLELHAGAVECCAQPSDRPIASPLARLQAARQPMVTTQRHETIRLTELQRHVLQQLDGEHDRSALIEVLSALTRQGTLVVQDVGPDAAKRNAVLQSSLEATLSQLARQALLIH